MKALFTALCVLTFATSASAATVTYNSATYEVSTITGRYDDNTTLLQSQVWWGDSVAARAFATLVSNLLGLPNNPSTAPLFASSASKNKAEGFAYFVHRGAGGVTDTAYNRSSRDVTYAVATLSAVPVPAAGLLLMSALAGVVALGRRRQKAAQA